MNTKEAGKLLATILEPIRNKAYCDLAQMVDGAPITGEATAPSGVCYQYEIEVFWDSCANGDVRVMGSIDDGGIRAYMPLSSSFIKAPDNFFVGE